MEYVVCCSVVVSESMLVGEENVVFIEVAHGDVVDVCCDDFVDCVEECNGTVVGRHMGVTTLGEQKDCCFELLLVGCKEGGRVPTYGDC